MNLKDSNILDVRTINVMPPQSSMDMPVQSFTRWDDNLGRKPLHSNSIFFLYLKRFFVFGGAISLTSYGAFEMYQVVSVSRTTVLQWILLGLFIINFYWISLAFMSGILGFFTLLFKKKNYKERPNELSSRTAVIMPIYNEGAERVFANLLAIKESIDQTGLGDYFDYFFLSDSTNPDAWLAEQKAFLDLKRVMGNDIRIFYRHRIKNTHRKSGNIAEFVTGWGGRYDHLLVLDADSIMTGDCIVRLTKAMEDDPDAGIIQTLPMIINRNTFFARLQQFAACIYGPIIATGVSSWSQNDGNYWGHNAIIRTKAFAAHCGLPVLSGKPPFGGHILSHDFIEAALIRRAGWSVYSLTQLKGSYEESPPSLIDLSIRDRRWCQGNLQHIRLLMASGFKAFTRQHLLTGIFAYLASPFWLSQLLIGILLVWQSTYIRPEYFNTHFSLFPVWPHFDSERALQLFILTMFILLAPKFFGIILALLNYKEWKSYGGIFRLFISSFIEIIMSALLAPVLTIIQSSSVIQILSGRDSGWNPQKRDDGSISWRDVYKVHKKHTVLGFLTGISAFLISTSLFLWMSPTITGLVFAIPLSWCSGSLGIGLLLRKLRLLLIPEEKSPPVIVRRIRELIKSNISKNYNDFDGLVGLKSDPELLRFHIQNLPQPEIRKKGDIDTDLAVARLKVNDAESVYEASLWLNTKERLALIKDKKLLGELLKRPLTYNKDT